MAGRLMISVTTTSELLPALARPFWWLGEYNPNRDTSVKSNLLYAWMDQVMESFAKFSRFGL